MSSTSILEFSNATQNVSLCLGFSIILIIFFIMTPLNKFLLSSIFGKIIILTLLGYTFYYNLQQTNKFKKDLNINIYNGKNWNSLKTNILSSYIFSLFLLILILSIIF